MVKPVLQAMVLADHVYQDRLTGKHIIAGTFTKIIFRKPRDGKITDGKVAGETVPVWQASQMGSSLLYLAFTSVHNTPELHLRFVDLSDASVLLELKFNLQAEDPVAVVELSIPMPRLPIERKKACYSLDLLWQNEQLGAWRIDADFELTNREEKE